MIYPSPVGGISLNRKIAIVYVCTLIYTVSADGYEEEDGVGLRVSVENYGEFGNITCLNDRSAVYYDIICDPEGETCGNTTFTENITRCNWNVTIRSELGCWKCSTYNSSSGSSTNLSAGSVFLIIFIVVVLTYIILGCAYNSFYHGRVGMDAIPNKNAWAQLTRYTRAGCELIRDTICCTHSPGAYQELYQTTKTSIYSISTVKP